VVLLFCFVLFFLMAYGIRRHTALWDSFAFVDLPPSSFLGSALVVVVFFRGATERCKSLSLFAFPPLLRWS